MKIKCYHGTTAEAYQSIIDNGFCQGDRKFVWTVSYPDVMYFYTVVGLINCGYIEEEDDDQTKLYRCIEMANSNAQLAAALHSTSDHTIVLCIEIDDNLLHVDNSCANMDHASYAYASDISQTDIVNVYSVPFFPKLSLLYLHGVIDQEYFDTSALSSLEIKMINALDNIDRDALLECDYTELPLPSLA